MTADNGAGASDRLQRKRQSSSANEALIVYLTGTRALDLAGGVRRQVWNRGVIARLTVGPGVDDFWTSHNDADWWNRSETDGDGGVGPGTGLGRIPEVGSLNTALWTRPESLVEKLRPRKEKGEGSALEAFQKAQRREPFVVHESAVAALGYIGWGFMPLLVHDSIEQSQGSPGRPEPRQTKKPQNNGRSASRVTLTGGAMLQRTCPWPSDDPQQGPTQGRGSVPGGLVDLVITEQSLQGTCTVLYIRLEAEDVELELTASSFAGSSWTTIHETASHDQTGRRE
ncbi:hypothetical protein POX_g08932 [Penicillium oxalicum]|uniref:hypothetical protein n=1 Tax=Penicillium oxalicum TaxID=69781 RepID=UPI0020B69CC1|nr:hypothetical protein POX_g08932 [Penicillium oxalicum]KAI2786546.1 hypothetical protein POX_g08932 [Penicillium oxalicum]